MTTVLEIRANAIKVNMNNEATLVAKYEDENGVYFFNDQLVKTYATATVKKKERKVSNLESFSFYVEYFQGQEMDTRRKFTTVKAKDLDKAIEKVQKNFKQLVSIETT